MEKYGISTRVIQGDASSAVSSSTCVVYFGSAYNSNEASGIPQHIYSYKEYLTKYHGGSEPTSHLTLDDCAEYALSLISNAWFVNCAKTAATSECAANDIKAVLEDALAYICLNSSDTPNIVCIPKVQDTTLLAELAKQCNGGINNVMHAQGFVDCAQNTNQIDTSGSPVATNITVPNTSGSLIAAWGNGILEVNESNVITKQISGSIILSAKRAEQDAININNVPYRSIGNIRTAIKGVCIHVEDSDIRCTCRQNKMNEVVENGIVSFVNKGNNRWYTWGDHTAAVAAGSVDDETYRFDSTVAVLYHILNRFVNKWENIIDKPMSLRLRDCIIAEEQDYLNGLKALGCLVGDPKCEFKKLENTAETIGKGQFYFSNIATVVPPAKYIDLSIQYTDDGLSAYIEE